MSRIRPLFVPLRKHVCSVKSPLNCCNHPMIVSTVRCSFTGRSIRRIIVSVPKKLFKRAVRRNILKRRIREAYRTQKALLGASEDHRDILFLYNSSEVLPFETIRAAVAEVLTRLS